MSHPTVSVIIPVYKTELYLRACLDSVLNQSFQDFEIICVNDGSPDNSAVILDEYAAKDKRITVLTQANQGISVARNQAMKLAVGKYVLFLDSDDLIHRQLLEMTTSLATKYSADMVSFAFIKKGPPKVLDYVLPPLADIPVFLTNNALEHMKRGIGFRFSWNTWSKLYLREVIQNIPFIEGICFEDYPHTLSIVKKNPKIVLTHEKLYYYRPNNTTSVSRSSFTVKKITDYRIGLNNVIDTYGGDAKRLTFIVRTLFPRILKAQYEQIRRTSDNAELWVAFTEELCDLQARGCLSWHGQFWRWVAYKWLLGKRG